MTRPAFKVIVASGAAVAALAFATTASAQYTGPSTQHIARTVGEVLKKPVDDQKVQLQGRILRNVNPETYIFADASGEIRVEIDDDKFPGAINDKAQVVIRGEVEKDLMSAPEIDVDAIELR